MAFEKAKKFKGKSLTLALGRGDITIQDGVKYTDERLARYVPEFLRRVPDDVKESVAAVVDAPVAVVVPPVVEAVSIETGVKVDDGAGSGEGSGSGEAGADAGAESEEKKIAESVENQDSVRTEPPPPMPNDEASEEGASDDGAADGEGDGGEVSADRPLGDRTQEGSVSRSPVGKRIKKKKTE